MTVGVIMAIGTIIWVLRHKRRTEIEREERFANAILRWKGGIYE